MGPGKKRAQRIHRLPDWFRDEEQSLSRPPLLTEDEGRNLAKAIRRWKINGPPATEGDGPL